MKYWSNNTKEVIASLLLVIPLLLCGLPSAQAATENLQGSDSNVTRFYLVSTQPCFTDAPERMTFSATGPAEALPDLLTAMDAQGLRLITLHDRPAKTILGEYVYLLECSGGGQDAYEQLAKECGTLTLRCLGYYQVTAGSADR